MHDALVGVVVTQDVAHLVHQRGQQVHVTALALVAGHEELGVVVRRGVDEPAPAGCVVVHPDGGSRRQAKGGAAEIGDPDVG